MNICEVIVYLFFIVVLGPNDKTAGCGTKNLFWFMDIERYVEVRSYHNLSTTVPSDVLPPERLHLLTNGPK